MPEDVTDKLAKFTPTGLDRDAVLFAAGKAAGRGWRGWKWVAAVLAVSNTVTAAVFLWSRTPPGRDAPPATPAYLAPEVLDQPDSPAPASYLALMRAFDSELKPATNTSGEFAPSPPLTPRSLNDPRFN